MKHDPNDTLEQELHRELRQLPGRRAPADLIARVQRALAARTALPWWARSWFDWPATARFGSAMATAALLLAVGWLFAASGDPIAEVIGMFSGFTGLIESLTSTSQAMLNAFSASLGVVPSAVITLAGVLLALMYLGCVAVGTVFYRVAVRVP
jgi:hypothetical protein